MEQELHTLLLLFVLFSPAELTDNSKIIQLCFNRQTAVCIVTSIIRSIFSTDLRVEPRNGGLVTLPSEDDLASSVTLTCLLYNAPRLGNTQWIVQNRVYHQIISTFDPMDDYTAHLILSGQTQEMHLTITSLSYKHSGSYTCQARSDRFSEWVSATIDLSLNRMSYTYIVYVLQIKWNMFSPLQLNWKQVQ